MKPLFLYTGPEFGERNDAIDKFRKETEKKLGSLDYHKLYASDVKIPELLTILQSGSLFDAGCFVVLHNSELIKDKTDIELLNNWQKSAEKSGGQDAILFLVSDEVGVDKKLEAIVDKSNKKVFWEMFDDRKEQWLYNFFKKNGYSIEQSAVEQILDLIENNTEALRNECSRFFVCFEKGYTITSQDVDNILAHNREENAFTLFEAACDTDRADSARLENALSILQKIRHSKESSSVALIAALSYCFRSLLVWHKIHAEGYPSEFDLKKAGFSSKKKQSQYSKASRLWNPSQTSLCLARLADCDMKIRSTGTQVEEIVLQTLMYSLILKKGLPLNEYESEYN